MNRAGRALVLIVTVTVLGALTAAGCTIGEGGPTASPSNASPTAFGATRSVVIDTDMAADDWMAILFLLGRPEVTVKAITVTGAGEAHCEPGVRNARALVALAGSPDVPVACGRETPLAGSHTFPDAWRDRVDDLLGVELPDGPDQADPGSAVELLAATLSTATDETTLLALGPLTDIAQLLEESPTVASKIDALYIMGGAVDVEGSVGNSGVQIDNPFAEWNI
jgi:inosine-uridine nucleoside N-ribohydrolase